MTKTCLICACHFTPRHGNQKLCSDACRVKNNAEGNAMRWRRRREERRDKVIRKSKFFKNFPRDIYIPQKLYPTDEIEARIKANNLISRIYRVIRRVFGKC